MDDKIYKMAVGMSAAEFKKLELIRKNAKKIETLRQKKTELEKELYKVDKSLAKLTGEPMPEKPRASRIRKGPKAPATAGTGRKAGPKKALPVCIREVLKASAEPMKIPQISEAVLKAGYSTKAAKIGPMISTTIAKMDDVERVGRGEYKLVQLSADHPSEKTESEGKESD